MLPECVSHTQPLKQNQGLALKLLVDPFNVLFSLKQNSPLKPTGEHWRDIGDCTVPFEKSCEISMYLNETKHAPLILSLCRDYFSKVTEMENLWEKVTTLKSSVASRENIRQQYTTHLVSTVEGRWLRSSPELIYTSKSPINGSFS